ncbi:MAG: hypothetical protein OXU26_06890 [Acidobacteriota bacterium]|nr:hypothetical protein [Acidobacteriota bacterium]MDE2963620.1 hypothetical protein [Acidobacteriota bacterium]
MNDKKAHALILPALAVMLFGLLAVSCAPAPEPEPDPEPPKPPSPVAAHTAFHRLYVQARHWSADSLPLRLSSFNLKEVPAKAGRYAVWQATFVSPQKRKSVTYTYSVVKSGTSIRKGVRAGIPEAWSGRGQARPFILPLFKIDSTKAYEKAAEQSAAFLKKNPDLPIHFLLESTPRYTHPVWRVIWGETRGSAKRTVFVDAATGLHLNTL